MTGWQARPLVRYFYRGRLSDFGTGFVWKYGLLRPKARSMYGTAHAGFDPWLAHYHKVHCKGKELSALIAVCRGKADCLRDAGPAPLADVDLFSCQRSEARQTARLRRAAGSGVYGSAAGLSPQAADSGEARVPKSIIQEGKKGSRSLMIVFMEMWAVIEIFHSVDADLHAQECAELLIHVMAMIELFQYAVQFPSQPLGYAYPEDVSHLVGA